MATRKVRYKKLNPKTVLPVFREDQIDPSEYESLTNEAQIATGVEQAEENVSQALCFELTATGHVPAHVTRSIGHRHHLAGGLTTPLN